MTPDSASPIETPQSAAADLETREGEVLAVGIGRLLDDGKRAASQVKVNDRVLFSSYAGTEVKLNGEEYLIMKEDDVLAVLTK